MTEMIVDFQTEAVDAAIAGILLALEPAAMMGWMKETVEPYIQQRATTRFAQEGDDVSGAWAPLSDATINYRTTGAVDYGTGPINHRTGALEEYVTRSSGGYASDGGDSVMTYPGAPPSGSNETGSLDDKLIAAQQGLANPSTPARPVLGINEKDLLFVTTELETYIMGVSL